MKRIFFDANVLFTAAHNPNGKAALVIELGATGHWRLVTSVYAAEEARRNLSLKFPSNLPMLEKQLTNFLLVHPTASAPRIDGLVDKDQPIFQAAYSCKSTHLLTGDIKDFGPWMNQPDRTYGIVIQTVAQFLESL